LSFALIAEELHRSHDYGGRSVFGWEPPGGAVEGTGEAAGG